VSEVQVLIEHVMREELAECIGASWGECTPTRRGYRNGSYTRDLVTSTGRIEDLKVPRDREGGIRLLVIHLHFCYTHLEVEGLLSCLLQIMELLYCFEKQLLGAYFLVAWISK